MKLHFLGTAAAEGFPNMFCMCDACVEARNRGGKDIRTRSGIIINDYIKIDFSADTHMQTLRDEIDLGNIKHLLVTHTHSDHLVAGDLEARMQGFAHNINYPLEIYGNSLVLKECKRFDLESLNNGNDYSLNLLLPFKTIKLEENMYVTPLLADHDRTELCYLYYIEIEGVTLLYGNDTGWFPEETWNWLKGRKIDIAILDCTVGMTGNNKSKNHMSVETVIHTRNKLKNIGSIHDESKVIATHISHNSKMHHNDLENVFNSESIEVAYDSMIINYES
ncbi:MAG TPA: MBL fold metallo-hydrolase [Pseudogracilibacillus sp.]|nr:MBL fold metallo-hydrolase [Pseudogracilibacillus sp.]